MSLSYPALLTCLVLTASAQENPADLSRVMAQVEARLADHDSAAALQLLRAEVAKNPTSVKLRVALGNVSLRAGEYDQAIGVYQSVAPELAQDPQAGGDLYLRIGEAYRRKGDLQNAVANLRRSTELRPQDVITMNTLALVLDQSGKKAEAAREYRALLELDPDNAVAMNNLAYLISESGGDLEEALKLAMRARELLPTLDEISDTLGWVELKMNHAEAAIAVFRGLVEKQPASANYRYHLGMALCQRGDTVEAAEQLRAALNYVPQEEIAAKILQLLKVLER